MPFDLFQDRVKALGVVAARDAAEFHRSFEEDLLERAPLEVEVPRRATFFKAIGRQGAVPMCEGARQDRGNARRLTVDHFSAVEHVKSVPLLDTTEVNGPSVHTRHGHGQAARMAPMVQIEVEAVFNGSLGPGIHSVHRVGPQFYPQRVAQGEHGIVLRVALVNQPLGLLANGLAQAVSEPFRGQPPIAAGSHVADIVGLSAVGGQGGHLAWPNACRVQKMGQALSWLDLARVHHEAVPNDAKPNGGRRHLCQHGNACAKSALVVETATPGAYGGQSRNERPPP